MAAMSNSYCSFDAGFSSASFAMPSNKSDAVIVIKSIAAAMLIFPSLIQIRESESC